MRPDPPLDRKLLTRARFTYPWLRPDVAENYKPVNKQYGRNHYSPTEIAYTFNSNGYRCEEFTEPSDFPIVFIGCSITEGIGLHLEQTWSYLLLEKIREKTGKNIPYWSLALTASGIDTQARKLYWYGKQGFAKPKMIIGLTPPMERREFSYGFWKQNFWLAGGSFPWEINHVFSDRNFAEDQSHRSFMIVDSLAEAWDAKVINAMWSYSFKDSSDESIYMKDAFPNFTHVDISDWKVFNKSWARDGMHWGPEMHQQIAEDYWCKVELLL